MNDMFNLYKYENMLYTMRLTGKEIRDALEMSYDLWTNRMNLRTTISFSSVRSAAKVLRIGLIQEFQLQLRFCGGYYLHGGCDQAGVARR